ncbi:MAG: hypothetical protein ABIG37_00860 [Nanoarchaeota archaeon]
MELRPIGKRGISGDVTLGIVIGLFILALMIILLTPEKQESATSDDALKIAEPSQGEQEGETIYPKGDVSKLPPEKKDSDAIVEIIGGGEELKKQTSGVIAEITAGGDGSEEFLENPNQGMINAVKTFYNNIMDKVDSFIYTLKNNAMVVFIDGFFKKINFVFRILFGIDYSLSASFFLVVIFWFIVFILLITTIEGFSTFGDSTSFGIALAINIILAQTKIFYGIVWLIGNIIDWIFNQSLIFKIIFSLVLIIVFIILFMFYKKLMIKYRDEREEMKEKLKEAKEEIEDIEADATKNQLRRIGDEFEKFSKKDKGGFE